MHPINVSFYSGSQTLAQGLLWLILAAVETLLLPPPSPVIPSRTKTAGLNQPSCFASPPPPHLNYLQAPCPLMKASSHGNEGNQINCMSANRITSSLTRHESGLKLITHAWKNGRLLEGRRDRARGSPRGGDSLLHAPTKARGVVHAIFI